MLDKTLVVKPAARLEIKRTERRGTLTVLLGAEVGAVHALVSPIMTLGRGAQAEISVEDDGISRRHCRILCSQGSYDLEDLGSTNGTYLDHERIEGRVSLREGARIEVGKTVLRFALQDELEQEASRRIYEMSIRDGLTGAYNRRYFDERMEAEFAFAVRHGTSLCVLMVDVDHFKRINDSFGHPAGDLTLRRIAAELREGVRTEDVVARYGGEEFAVIARGIDPSGARLFAERLRLMVERTHIEWEGARIAVTASIGCAHNHSGAAVASSEQLVSAADGALYAAKRAGRNRVQAAVSPGRYSSSDSSRPDARSRSDSLDHTAAERQRKDAVVSRSFASRSASTQDLNPGSRGKR